MFGFNMDTSRRFYLLGVAGLGASLVALSACEQKPSFRNTDITGADFARQFALTDHNGKARTLADFKGQATIVFFGFTRCPDICPTTLAEMSEVMKQLGDDAKKVQVLFITVDPERDTPDVLSKYVPSFHPSFLGLSGSAEQIASAAKEFKVFYQKVPGKTPESYTMDHFAGSYVFDRDNKPRLMARNGAGPEPLVADLKQLLK